MAGTTYSKFFWQDWFGDKKLRLCSAGAQAFWMRCLCVAAESETPGHVLVSGVNPTDEDLSDLFGPRSFPVADVERWRKEVIERGVCDVDRDGVMVSRRMIRDARRRKISSEGGKSRQRQRAENNEQSSVGTRHVAQPPSTINQNPSTTNHQPPPNPQRGKPGSLEVTAGRVSKIETLLGLNLTTQTGRAIGLLDDLRKLDDAGIDFELDLLPTIAGLRDAGKIPRDLQRLTYFEKPALRFREQRLVREKINPVPDPNAPAPEVSKRQWIEGLNKFLQTGFWNRFEFGPLPVEDGCRAPKELLSEAEVIWNEQGQSPTEGYERVLWKHHEPVPFWGSNVAVLKAKQA